MKLKAKEIIENKFWILEENGEKIGTVAFNDNYYMLSDGSGPVRWFKNKTQISQTIGNKIKWDKLTIKETPANDVHGFPTKVTPYNAIFDIKRKLPLFTKSEASKSYFCAGYYLVRFNVLWLKAYCPKLITLDRNEFLGPWKTEIEQKIELKKINAD